ncbi:MAG: hypothetical protein HYW26_00740 [Candidatus Aenigmarchaeota archaeon]|nr:hypothetical protein [Candidatus Aenigmarchaeota archaeon]
MQELGSIFVPVGYEGFPNLKRGARLFYRGMEDERKAHAMVSVEWGPTETWVVVRLQEDYEISGRAIPAGNLVLARPGEIYEMIRQ